MIAPCYAGELDSIEPSTQFYVRVPIGPGATAKDRAPSFGLAIKGRREYQVFTLDSRMFDSRVMNFDGGLLAAIEAKWLLVGAVAVGGAVAVSQRAGGGSTNNPPKQGTAPTPEPDCTKTC